MSKSMMKKRTKAAIGAAVLAAAGWVLVQNRMLVTDELTLTVPDLPEAFDGKRILHISDLHKKRYGEGFNNLINSCAFLKPDLIFFTGDLFSRDERNLEPKLVLMRRLMKIGPVYYVTGNHEADAPDCANALNSALSKEGVHVLLGRSERIYEGEAFITVTGAALPKEHYRSEKGYSQRQEVTPGLMRDLVGEPDHGSVNFLLVHDPLPFEAYAEWGADVTFAGHVHGGVIRLPFIGGLLSPERRFFPKYSKGLYRLGKAQMIVSAGLGKFRLCNPSQLILVTLKRGLVVHNADKQL